MQLSGKWLMCRCGQWVACSLLVRPSARVAARAVPPTTRRLAHLANMVVPVVLDETTLHGPKIRLDEITLHGPTLDETTLHGPKIRHEERAPILRNLRCMSLRYPLGVRASSCAKWIVRCVLCGFVWICEVHAQCKVNA